MWSEEDIQKIQKEIEAALRFVAGYILVPVLDWSQVSEDEKQKVRNMAEIAFNGQPLHQCYWNDRFCLATMCNMSEEQQRVAAWCMVSNGLTKYWEWTTHRGYPLYLVLDTLRMISLRTLENSDSEEQKMGVGWSSFTRGYSRAPHKLLQKIVERYRLPTTYFSARILSPEEQKEREKFNRIYAKSLVNCVL